MIALRKGMEIDLGGLGKEYAVDRALAAIRAVTSAPALVNFGGDLRVSGPRKSGARWNVAIESVERSGDMAGLVELANGALATSGDFRRFLLKDGVRYSHILDPRIARPVADPPRSVTVAAATCIEAGMIATLAMLQGRRAEKFLKLKARAPGASARPMSMKLGWILLGALVCILIGYSESRAASAVKVDHVELSVALESAAKPGSTVWAAIRQRIEPGWHTYWSNPGDWGRRHP